MILPDYIKATDIVRQLTVIQEFCKNQQEQPFFCELPDDLIKSYSSLPSVITTTTTTSGTNTTPTTTTTI